MARAFLSLASPTGQVGLDRPSVRHGSYNESFMCAIDERGEARHGRSSCRDEGLGRRGARAAVAVSILVVVSLWALRSRCASGGLDEGTKSGDSGDADIPSADGSRGSQRSWANRSTAGPSEFRRREDRFSRRESCRDRTGWAGRSPKWTIASGLGLGWGSVPRP